MKNICLSVLIVLLLLSCKKQEAEQFLNHISAGQKSGPGILYSDIPDIQITFYTDPNGIYKSSAIDLNRDGINDFNIIYQASASPGHYTNYQGITPLVVGSAIATPGTGNLADTIAGSAIIDDHLNWSFKECIIYYYASPSTEEGLWKNAKNKYIGVKTTDGVNVVFGWIRIETNGYTFTLYDYAGTIGF